MIVVTAIALGLWAAVFLMSFSNGMLESRTRDIIETQISHIQIHDSLFERGGEVKYILNNGAEILKSVSNKPYIKAASGRILTSAMLESSNGNFGVELIGIDPVSEAELTGLEGRLIAGEYFNSGKSASILVGEKLAEKIGVKVVDETGKTNFNFRRRIVFRFQTASNEISSLRVRVSGVYETTNTLLEESQVFIQNEELGKELEIPGEFHEIAMLLTEDKSKTLERVNDIEKLAPGAKVEGWMQIAPDIELLAETSGSSMQVFLVVILLALAFGIINTMLMAVLERTRELGMLMSVGMNKKKVFLMIMQETIFLTIIGAPIGVFIGWLCITYYGNVGLDLSTFAEGAGQMGLSSMVYPALPGSTYLEIAIMVFITALLSAIYPARKALQLKPAEAVRAV